ncbi:hypothetical protein Ab1vBOLIVR5_gp188 [Agrobacterium phage OLIVR5]|uniref:Uncharacterized protein n=1 Tax=Agrobacterium phage OLIVR5 TaxID=2723773 RepID=A0A858MSZ3_9CAUD|nr:hypothetical protein KNU99_gp213 [Agrobacterium phage OLIVR5]QIW87836.1 hypothetical protein Ab1vBOLIVR5_gp188 [Agrobacterium phage OLIVR5]QIW88101.1 hypothetical protein Ab1vBOLIVR6_gp194 [Agrobacterium phage OLIVR6]
MTRLVRFATPLTKDTADFCERMTEFMIGYNPKLSVYDKGLNGSHIEIIFEGPLTDCDIKYLPLCLEYMAPVKVRLLEE